MCLCSSVISPFPLLHADRPIASIAFHAQGEVLAVASGHKVRWIVPYMYIFYLDCYTTA